MKEEQIDEFENALEETVASWAPPAAPLVMPRQVLELSFKERFRVKLASIVFLRERT